MKSIKKIATKVLRAIDPNDKHMREIILGSSISFIMKLIGAGLNFGFNALLARQFGADGTGIYFLALSVSTLSVMLGRAGLDNVLLRYVASGASVNDWSLIWTVYIKGFFVASVLSFVISVSVFLLSPWLAHTIFQKESVELPIKYISLGIVPVVFLTLYGEILKGLKKVFLSQLVQGAGFQLVCFVTLYLGSRYTLDNTIPVLSYVFSAWVLAVIGYMAWHFNIPKVRKRKNNNFTYNSLVHSAFPLFVVSALSLSYNWINTLLLGAFGTKADVGIFSLAFRTAMLISFVLVAVNTISAPKFAEIFKSGNLDILGATARKTVRLMVLIATPILSIFLIFPSEIMGIFGEEFKVGSSTLVVLSVAQYVNVVAGSVGYLLMMTGNEVQVRNSNFYSAVVCIILSVVLVPKLNFFGAGISISIALILRNIMEVYFVRKYLGIEIFMINFSRISALGSTVRKRISG